MDEPKNSYSARDHFLSLVDSSNWGDWMEGEFYKGYSEAMATVHEGVMDWWDELSAKTLAQPQLRDAPEGFKLVPIKPTEEMLERAFMDGPKSDYEHDAYGYFEEIWETMLKAAPQKKE